MRSALHYVIDFYDEYIASVEQSHYEELNYNEVIDFIIQESETKLDLTWMDKDDVFKLRNSKQYEAIDTIVVSIDNLAYSSLSTKVAQLKNIQINAVNSNLNFIQQIKAFREFISNNRVNSIKFVGFNKAVESILKLYAKKFGISINDDELTDEIHKYR